MPELPDLAVVADAFHAGLAGRQLLAMETVAPLAVRGIPAEIDALSGRHLSRLTRRGKFLLLELERDRIVINPMLTGRLQLAVPGLRRPTSTAAVLRFGPRPSRPRGAAAWTRRARWMPADDAIIEVRFRDPTQMGKIYVVPHGVERPVAGLDDAMGPDADDPALTIEIWRSRIRRHPGELKNLLRNQRFIAGIGNAYSDEILHAAGLLPSRTRASLDATEVDRLYEAVKTTLADAIDVLRARVPPTFETQVRDFLAVHGKGGQSCPRCGTRISELKAGGFVTSFCRGCQR